MKNPVLAFWFAGCFVFCQSAGLLAVEVLDQRVFQIINYDQPLLLFGGSDNINITAGIYDNDLRDVVSDNFIELSGCTSHLLFRYFAPYLYISCQSTSGRSFIVRYDISNNVAVEDSAFYIELDDSTTSNPVHDLFVIKNFLLIAGNTRYPTVLKYFLDCENRICRQDRLFGLIQGSIREPELDDEHTLLNTLLFDDSQGQPSFWVAGRGARISECMDSPDSIERICNSGALLLNYDLEGNRLSGIVIEQFGSSSEHKLIASFGKFIYAAGTTEESIYLTRYFKEDPSEGYDTEFRIRYAATAPKIFRIEVREDDVKILFSSDLISVLTFTFNGRACQVQQMPASALSTITDALFAENNIVIAGNNGGTASQILTISDLNIFTNCTLTPPTPQPSNTNLTQPSNPTLPPDMISDSQPWHKTWWGVTALVLPSVAISVLCIVTTLTICVQHRKEQAASASAFAL